MKTFTLLFLASVSLAAAGCQQTSSENAGNRAAGNQTMNHDAMSHNSANRNAVINASSHDGAMDHSQMKSSPNAAAQPFDLQFLDTMAMHHEGAVEMAKMVENRTQNAELKKFAAQIIADQNKEIEQMKSWREKWYAGKPAALNMEMPGMAGSMRMDMEKLAAAKDKNFDLMFLEMMIPHHEGAVSMAKDALGKAEHQEIKTLADQIIKAQNDEIKLMEKWKTDWSK